MIIVSHTIVVMFHVIVALGSAMRNDVAAIMKTYESGAHAENEDAVWGAYAAVGAQLGVERAHVLEGRDTPRM